MRRGARAVTTVVLTSMRTRLSGQTVPPSHHRCGPSLMIGTVPTSGGLYSQQDMEVLEKLAWRPLDPSVRPTQTSLSKLRRRKM